MDARALGTWLAALSAGFAVVHVAWAVGWRAGVPADVPPISDRPVFWTYDVVSALLMVAAAVVAAVLARGGLPRRTTETLVRLTVVGSLLALLRGAPALALDVVLRDLAGVGPVADLWFVVVGCLGLALAASVRRRDAAARRGTPAPGRPRRPAGAR